MGTNPNRTGQLNGVIDGLVTYNAPLNMHTNTWIVTATSLTSPPRTVLQWSGLTNVNYRIERRTVPLTQWVTIASLPPPRFTDSKRRYLGREYEYRVSADVAVPDEFYSSSDPAYATVHSWASVCRRTICPGTSCWWWTVPRPTTLLTRARWGR